MRSKTLNCCFISCFPRSSGKHFIIQFVYPVFVYLKFINTTILFFVIFHPFIEEIRREEMDEMETEKLNLFMYEWRRKIGIITRREMMKDLTRNYLSLWNPRRVFHTKLIIAIAFHAIRRRIFDILGVYVGICDYLCFRPFGNSIIFISNGTKDAANGNDCQIIMCLGTFACFWNWFTWFYEL